MKSFTIQTRNVNSKVLLAEVTTFIEDILENFSVSWNSDQQRDIILEVIEEQLQDLADASKLTQWNLVCDGRNNKASDLQKSTTHLDISYRQEDCYNVTQIKYTIQN